MPKIIFRISWIYMAKLLSILISSFIGPFWNLWWQHHFIHSLRSIWHLIIFIPSYQIILKCILFHLITPPSTHSLTLSIYNELGWETLDERRMIRRLVQCYNHEQPNAWLPQNTNSIAASSSIWCPLVLKLIECKNYGIVVASFQKVEWFGSQSAWVQVDIKI